MALVLPSLIVGVSTAQAGTTPQAAAGDFLQIRKTVDHPTPTAGEPFTYSVRLTCSESDCLNAALEDPLPAALAGFAVRDVTFQPAPTAVPRAVTWTTASGSSSTPPTTLDTKTALRVDFIATTHDPAGTGLVAGKQFTAVITLQVPQSYPPGDSGQIVNTATGTATNAVTVTADAPVRISVPVTTGVRATKTWTPARQNFAPGTVSTATISATNTSNTAAQQLVIQEPSQTPDAAAALDPANPFTANDFSAFSSANFPTGCASAVTEAYVRRDGSYLWVAGAATSPPALALPAGVATGDVRGVRLTCRGSMGPQAQFGVGVDVAQRATSTSGADLSQSTQQLTDTALTRAVVAGQPDATDTADATHTVAPNSPSATVITRFTPKQVTAGSPSSVTVTGTNTGVPVSSLRVTDGGYFTDGVRFAGFDGPATFPTGATEGTLVYTLRDGTTQSVPLTRGETPPPARGPVASFAATFTGNIPANTAAAFTYRVDTTDTATGDAPSITVTDTATITVTAPNGRTGSDTSTDQLVVTKPQITTSLDKYVSRRTGLQSGDSIVVSLAGTTVDSSDTVDTRSVVFTDAAQNGGDFWNAFDLTEIAPTAVPADTTLLVEVQGSDGSWRTLRTFRATLAPITAGLDAAATAAALQGLGLSAEQVAGVRYTFTSDRRFPTTVGLTPNTGFRARSLKRDGTGPVSPDEATAVAYTNRGIVRAKGVTPSGAPLTAEASDSETVTLRELPPAAANRPRLGKAFDRDTIPSQSGQQTTAVLDWTAGNGYSPVTIDDPSGDPGTPAATAYDAFDLVSIAPIYPSTTPYSNGWYLRYDTITSVQLYENGAWITVPAPAGGWSSGGAFPGYTLSAAERAATTGVRLVLEETAANTVARRADRTPSNPDVPAPGSGVAAGSGRQFGYVYQLRNTRRSDGSLVTAAQTYNAGAAVVRNVAAVVGTPIPSNPDQSPTRTLADDTITVIDAQPGVSVTKTATPTARGVPGSSTPAGSYPTVAWTLEATNTSPAQASYVRVTDPAVCAADDPAGCRTDATAAAAVADPFLDPGATTITRDWLNPGGAQSAWDRFDITGVTVGTASGSGVDLSASTVWLLRYDAASKTYTSQRLTAAEINAGAVTDWSDVVGISTTFQGPEPNTSGAVVTAKALTLNIASRLRPTVRSTGGPQLPDAAASVDTVNRVAAQSYDPVLSPGIRTGALGSAVVNLSGGSLSEDPYKRFDQSELRDSSAHPELNAYLGSYGDPRSTLPAAKIVFEDKAPEFWQTFDFAGFTDPKGFILDKGVDRLRVDVYGPFGPGGTLTWLNGPDTAPRAPTVPVGPERYGDIQGVRFTFDRADGGTFADPYGYYFLVGFRTQARSTYRDTGAPIVFSYQTVTNTATTQVFSPDGIASTARPSSRSVDLVPGYRALAVQKVTNDGDRTASVGEEVPYRLRVTNVGGARLTLTRLTDVLPPQLLYTGANPIVQTYAADSSLAQAAVSVAADGHTLTFTWPSGGQTLLPGESFTIDYTAELQPGLDPGAQAVNTMTASTVESLAYCRNVDPNGTTTGAYNSDPHTCGTTDYVTRSSGSNLYTIKGVRTDLANTAAETASVPGRPDVICRPLLVATGGSYYRAPCQAGAQVGGTENWVLHSVNAGDGAISAMTIFEQLPFTGDTQLISGASRGSTFRPQLIADSLKVTAPPGAVATVQTTSSPGPCVGTWPTLVTAPACEQHGEQWSTVSGSTDWAAVTGLRVIMDFAGTATGQFESGQSVDVTYSTRNVPAAASNPDGAQLTPTAAGEIAYNQHGVKFRFASDPRDSKIAPGRVGINIATGSLSVTKTVTGPAARYAPATIDVAVACTAAGVAVDLGSDATLTLSRASGYSGRIDGLPLGSQCTVTETGAVGSYDETSRTGSGTATITVPTLPNIPIAQQAVPAGQRVTIGNDYQYTGLSLRKLVRGTGPSGPFAFDLSCRTATGTPVVFDDGGTRNTALILNADQTVSAPADRIPVGATCTLAESGSGASQVTFAGPAGAPTSGPGSVIDNGNGTATVRPGATPLAVTATNVYGSGTLTVTKRVTGSGAALYGAPTYAVRTVCTYRNQPVLDTVARLAADGSIGYGPYTAGTECTVTEPGSGGATSTTTVPASGQVVIPGPTGGQTLGAADLTVTNTFDTTSLAVVKQLAGTVGDPSGVGPFTVALSCTRRVDGVATGFDIPGGAERVLTPATQLRALYADLPTGATCRLAETDTGGAASTSISLSVPGADPLVTQAAAATLDLTRLSGGAQATATVTNTFDTTSLRVQKVVTGNTGSPGAAGPFTVSLACTRGGSGSAFDIPGGAARTLDAANGLAATYTRLPTDARCQLTETGSGGASATTISVATRDRTPVTTTGTTAPVDLTGTGIGDVTATITNAFTTSAITVAKTVRGDTANPDSAGPFTVSLACTRQQGGTAVPVTIPGGAQRVLSAANMLQATYAGIASDARCVITETDPHGASSSRIVVTVAGGAPVTTDATSAPVDLSTATGSGGATVDITNTFTTTSLAVVKTVAGAVANPDSAGPFTVTLSCTRVVNGVTEPVTVPGGASRSLSAADQYRADYSGLLPTAQCRLAETDTHGAASTSIAVAVRGRPTVTSDGTATTVDLTGTAAGDATATITNTYTVTSLDVVKTVAGATANPDSAGPFTVSLACTRTSGGQAVTIPNGASRVLSAANQLRTTYADLPPDARCTLTETGPHGAASTSISVAVRGRPATSSDGTSATVDLTGTAAGDATATITNTFATTSLTVVKQIAGSSDNPDSAGPFTVSLACTRTVAGQAVAVVIPGGAQRSLSAANGLRTVYADLPPDAVCTLNETDTHGAASTAIRIAVAGRPPTTTEGTSATVDLTGTAAGDATATVVNTFTISPALSLVKSVTPASVAKAGETVTYSFLVTNTGDVTLRNVAVTETAFSGSGTAPVPVCPAAAASLAPRASVTCTATYTVTQADIDAGTVTNTAVATGTPPSGPPPVSPPSQAPVTATPAPGISLVKSATPVAVAKAGDTVTYSFLVTNTGNVTLRNVAVSETAFSGTGRPPVPVCPAAAASLAPQASVTCTATYTVTQADIDAGTVNNTAVSTGTPPSGPPPTSPPSVAVISSTPTPGISLVKSASPARVGKAGDTVTYSFLVTNTGNVTLSDVVVRETAFSGTGTAPVPVCPAAAASLAIGASVTCTGTYTVTQADIDAGTVTNTAVATGTPPSGPPPTSPPSKAVVTSTPEPALTLVKSVTPASVAKAGDTVAYSFLVTNTGNVTLTGIAVRETAFSGTGTQPAATCPTTPLAIGASLTCTATYTVTQADIDAGTVRNTAVATGTPPAGPPPTSPPSSTILTSTPVPGISLVKTVQPATVAKAGATVTYSFLVTNTGDTTLTDVTVAETAFSGTGPVPVPVCPAGAASLAPRASVTCTATYTVTQADIDAGRVTNTAVATGTPPSGPPPTSPPAKAVVTAPPEPGITLVKSASPATVGKAGDSVTYSFLVTNTGTTTLTDVVVSETAFTGTGRHPTPTCPASAASLAPGAHVVCTATYTFTQADVDAGSVSNTAVTRGTPPGGKPPLTSPPSVTTVSVPGGPAIALVKSATPASVAKAGDTVTYSFLVTNTGTVTLTGTQVTETAFSGTGTAPTPVCPAGAASLLPGASVTCTATYAVTQADIDAGTVTNTAVATGTPPSGPPPTSPPSSAVVTSTPEPGISLVKSVQPATVAKAGATVTYSFLVTNTGDTTLTDVTVAETAFSGTGPVPVPVCPAGAASLAPRASVTCTAAYVVMQADIDAGRVTNTAVATGTPPSGPPPTSPPSKAVVTAPPEPALTLVKSASPASVARAGDAVTYSFLVTNTGNVTLSDVTVAETAFTGTGPRPVPVCPAGAASLAPRASVTCTATYPVTQADIDAGTVRNTAVATGTPPAGPPPTSPPSKAVVTAPPEPALTLVKSASPASVARAGDAVTYSFLVTNTGNVTLSDVTVAETAFSGTGTAPVPVCPAAAASLAVGASVTCTATYPVTQADIDAGTVRNTAVATGTPPAGPPPTSPPSNAVVTATPTPEIRLVKTARPSTVARAGDTVTYSFLVTNTGNVTLSDVTVAETAFSGTGTAPVPVCPAAAASLVPGAQVVCTATYTVTQADVDAGAITNTAVATGVPPGGTPPGTDPPTSPPSSAPVDVPPEPGLTIVKSASPLALVDFTVGRLVTYTFVITNTGNVTLRHVDVRDDAFSGTGRLSGLTCPDGDLSLAPAAQVTCTATYRLTQADVDRGTVSNHTTATGEPPSGPPPEAKNHVDLPGDPDPGLSLVKSVTPATVAKVGDRLTYTFLITNIGNVTLRNVTVREGAFSGTGALSAVTCPPEAASMAPGAIVRCTAGYTVTRADVASGRVINTATAVGDPPAGPPTASPPSSTDVPSAGRPQVRMTKTGRATDTNRNGITDPGDTVSWLITVTNTGTVAATSIRLSDPTAGVVTCPRTTLDPGGSMVCTAPPRRITAADAARGSMTNVVTGVSTPPPTPDDDDPPPTDIPPATATVVVHSPPLDVLGTVVHRPATGTRRPSGLAWTGVDIEGRLLGGAALICAGLLTLLVARRRRRT